MGSGCFCVFENWDFTIINLLFINNIIIWGWYKVVELMLLLEGIRRKPGKYLFIYIYQYAAASKKERKKNRKTAKARKREGTELPYG